MNIRTILFTLGLLPVLVMDWVLTQIMYGLVALGAYVKPRAEYLSQNRSVTLRLLLIYMDLNVCNAILIGLVLLSAPIYGLRYVYCGVAFPLLLGLLPRVHTDRLKPLFLKLRNNAEPFGILYSMLFGKKKKDNDK